MSLAVRRVVLVCVLLVLPVAALAQTRQWEIEVHAGGSLTSNPSGGTSTSPPPGTALLSPIPTRPTRRISSWYYGDGAALLNGVADGLQVFRSFPDRMTPLDSVLANPLPTSTTGGAWVCV